MDIQHLGHSSFFIKTSKGTLITDPFDSKMVGLHYPRREADIVTVSHDHNDHNMVSLIDGDPFVCRFPGEYEKNGIHVTGYPSYHDNKSGGERGKNTLFKIEADHLTLLHCGDLGHVLSNELLEEIGNIDIIFIPIGGIFTISSDEAIKIINEIEPSIVIPMHFFQKEMNKEIFGKLETVDQFIHKIGVESVQRVKKLTVKKDFLADGCTIVLFDPNA